MYTLKIDGYKSSFHFEECILIFGQIKIMIDLPASYSIISMRTKVPQHFVVVIL